MGEKVKLLWELLRGQRLRFAGAAAGMLLAAALGYARPLIAGWAIDYILKGQRMEAPAFVARLVEAVGGRSVLLYNLWIAAGTIVVVTAFSGLFTYLRGVWSAVAAERIARGLRERLYDQLQHLPTKYHDKADPGDLVQRCTSDVDTIRTFLSSSVTEVAHAVVLLGIGLPMMFSISVPMAISAVVLLPFIIAYSCFFFLRVQSTFKQMDEAEGRMTATLEENLTGIRVVRAFARGPHEIEKFAKRNGEYRRHWLKLIQVLSWFWSVSDFLCLTQVGVVLIYGAWRVTRGLLSVGGLYAFVSFVHLFLWPVRHMGRVLADWGKATVSLGRVGAILHEPRESTWEIQPEGWTGDTMGIAGTALRVASPPHTKAGDAQPRGSGRHAGEMVVEGLCFSHTEGRPALQDVSFRAAPGETLAILGPSGCGKSTLVGLLLRLYDYSAGSIRVDGRELSALPRKVARGHFGAVLQEPFLYARSVGDNIRLGRHDAAMEQLTSAAEAAGIHETILTFEKGYDTLVGERGVMLSGGQRQRVAIARALLKDPPVLILDDALSAVDTHTETAILDALRSRSGRRTTLLIAHRLSTLRRADRILTLEGGRVTQCGTHDELVRQEGLYRRLWRIQSDLQEELDAETAGASGDAAGATGGAP
jgi:ATP-binding cassette subfamily B protein